MAQSPAGAGTALPPDEPTHELSPKSAAEEKFAVATQLQLTWWRFKKHKLAYASGVLVILFYLIALFADFLAYESPHATDATRSYIPPQGIHFFDENGFNPWVPGLTGKRDPRTFKLAYVPDPSQKRYLEFFAQGYPYDLFGFIPTDRHLIGLKDAEPKDGLFLLGTDLLGRDLWSRLMLATRTSLTIGLVGVTLSCSWACCWAASPGFTAASSIPSSSG